MIKRHFIPAAMAAFASLGLTQIAQANIEDLIDDSLSSLTDNNQSLSNVTDPSMGMTQRRGYLSGGSVSYRGKIVNTNIVNAQAPRITAGCGGIDLFGGSFSFINADQLKALLKAVASNAQTYAFSLALDNMCPTCNKEMQKWADWVNQLNQNLSDSCEAAQWLVDNSGLEAGLQNVRTKILSDTGTADDNHSAKNTQLASGKTQEEAAEGSPAEPLFNDIVYGNIVWRALKSDKGLGATALGNNQTAEAIMSLVGTVIVTQVEGNMTYKDHDADTSETDSRKNSGVVQKPMKIGLKELLKGSNEADNGTVTPVSIYGCNDGYGENACRELTEKNVVFEGFSTKIREILVGSPGAPGLVEKFARNTGTIDPDERVFMQNAPGSITAMLRNIAKDSESTAKMFAIQASNQIALSYAYTLSGEIFQSVMEALSAFPDDPKAVEAINMVKANMDSLNAEASLLGEEFGPISDLARQYKDIASMKRARVYFTDASTGNK